VDGEKNDFVKRWIANGWKEKATDRPVIIFDHNLIICFPL